MAGVKGFKRSLTHSLALAVSGFASFQSLHAGSIDHGRINAPGVHAVAGIAFDNNPGHNPLISDDQGGRVWRINLNDASLLESFVIADSPLANHSLEPSGTAGIYYQIGDQPNRLHTTNLPGLITTPAANDVGAINNFYELGMNPTNGNLYMLTSDINVNLYQINISTGSATLVHAFGELGPTVGAMSAMAFGPDGTLYCSSISSPVFEDRIFRLDPSTWSFIPVTSLGFSTPDMLNDFTYDPSQGKWYGIKEVRSADPDRHWRLVEITGITPIPEPGGIAILCAVGAACASIRRRWRSSQPMA